MGNIFEAPPSSVDESLLYLNHNEIASTKELFDRLYKDDGAAYPRFLATFSSKLLADIFHFRLSQERYHSPKVFERFIIDCTRSGKAIPTLWELTRDKADNNLDGLNIFFAAISLMACPSKDGIFVIREDEDDVLLHRVPVKMLAFFQSYLYKIDPKFVQSLNGLQPEFLYEFIDNFFPNTSKAIETYIGTIAFPKSIEQSASFKAYLPATLDVPSAVVDEIDLIPLSLFSTHLQGEWTRLYSVQTDGLSFNRVAHHIKGYDGPTCLLIRPIAISNSIPIYAANDSKPPYVLGALAVDGWKEMNRFTGSSGNCLFSLSSQLRFYRTKYPTNSSYQYLNSKTFGMPHGLGFGGSSRAGSSGASAVPSDGTGFRLFIPDSLEGCFAMSSCLTYEAGRLLFPPPLPAASGGGGGSILGEDMSTGSEGCTRSSSFEIDVMEVWGCGGSAETVQNALDAQQEQRAATSEAIQKARKVDKAAFFDSEFDQEMFLGKTFAHNKGRRGDDGHDYGLQS